MRTPDRATDWANWARVFLVIRSTTFELRACQRGKRLRWKKNTGKTSVFNKFIAHYQTGICWREVSHEEVLTASGTVDMANSRLGPKPTPMADAYSAVTSR